MKPENPYQKPETFMPTDTTETIEDDARYFAWQEGFDTLVKWLKSSCLDHSAPENDGRGLTQWSSKTRSGWIYTHHKDCPQCWQELKR